MVDATWQRIGGSSGFEINKLRKRHLKLQKPLSLFIDRHVDFYREEAAGVFLYVAHAILEAALSCSPRPKKISTSMIESVAAKLKSEGLTDDEFHLSNYAYEAFTELDKDDVVLSTDELETMLDSISILTMCIHQGFSGSKR